MAFSYDVSNLDTTTVSGRTNIVRLLVGDNDDTDPQTQDEEIAYALSQVNDNTFFAAAWICRAISAKYARLVTTIIEGTLRANYSDRAKQYSLLALQIESQGKKSSGTSLGLSAGGLSKADMTSVNSNTDRVTPAFGVTQFDNPGASGTNPLEYLP